MSRNIITYAFELKIVPAVSTARKRTKKYGGDGTEPMEGFWAKSLHRSPALLGFGKGGA